MTDDSQRLQRLVNASGFPFQIGVVKYLKRTQLDHHFKVLHTEHSWRGKNKDQNGFIDLIIEHPDLHYLFVIECKRVQGASWIFLVPENADIARRQAKLWVTQFEPAVTRYQRFGWNECPLEPSCPESGYCVVEGQDERRPMLERVAADLVMSTEAFAKEDAVRVEAVRTTWPFSYASIIVTNAKLVMATFDASTISLDDGKIPELHTTEVPFVRFRKQLSTDHVGFSIDEVRRGGATEISRAKERTVFVVQANTLSQFISSFEIDHWHG
jgi:hypothetical protein